MLIQLRSGVGFTGLKTTVLNCKSWGLMLSVSGARGYSASLKSPTEAQVRHLAGPREFSREITRWREHFHTGSLLITADVCQRESRSFSSYMLKAANTALLLNPLLDLQGCCVRLYIADCDHVWLIYFISVFLPLHCFWITKYFHVKANSWAAHYRFSFALLKCIRNAFFNKSEGIVLSTTNCCLSLNRRAVLKIVTKKVLTDEFIIVQWYDPDWVIRFHFFPLNNQWWWWEVIY